MTESTKAINEIEHLKNTYFWIVDKIEELEEILDTSPNDLRKYIERLRQRKKEIPAEIKQLETEIKGVE